MPIIQYGGKSYDSETGLETAADPRWWLSAARSNMGKPGSANSFGTVVNPNTGAVERLGMSVDEDGNPTLLPESIASSRGYTGGSGIDYDNKQYKPTFMDNIGDYLLQAAAAGVTGLSGLGELFGGGALGSAGSGLIRSALTGGDPIRGAITGGLSSFLPGAGGDMSGGDPIMGTGGSGEFATGIDSIPTRDMYATADQLNPTTDSHVFEAPDTTGFAVDDQPIGGGGDLATGDQPFINDGTGGGLSSGMSGSGSDAGSSFSGGDTNLWDRTIDKLGTGLSSAWDKNPLGVLSAGVGGLGTLAGAYNAWTKGKDATAHTEAVDATNAVNLTHRNNPLGVTGPMQGLSRTRTDPLTMRQALQYGAGPERSFFNPYVAYDVNATPAVPHAHGGPIGAYTDGHEPSEMIGAGGLGQFVRGPGGGQDDKVSAALSPGEYVFDASATSELGDGNPEEGARKLDKLRVAIRKHKRSAPASSIPPKAKKFGQYSKDLAQYGV